MADEHRATTKRLATTRWDNVVIGVVGALLALALRYSLRGHQTGDFQTFTGVWYDTLQAQGFSAFATVFYDYTPTYLYFFYLTSRVFPWFSDVAAVKLTAIVFDFVCAGFVYGLVRLRYRQGSAPLLAALVTLFAPTVVINSAFWGQNDITYTTGLVACLFFTIRRQSVRAFLAFGVALAFKLQAVFLAPLLLILLLRRWLAWRGVLLVPLVYLVAIAPAWLQGRSLSSLLLVYVNQADTYRELSMGAPNLYTWFPDVLYDLLYPAGLVWAVAVVFLFVVLVAKSRAAFSAELMVHLALLSVLLVPYMLPKMHDRYFFAADVMAILYGFSYPRQFWVPVVIGLCSFFAYTPYLFGMTIVAPSLLALVLLGVMLFLLWKLLPLLYPQHWQPEAMQPPRPL